MQAPPKKYIWKLSTHVNYYLCDSNIYYIHLSFKIMNSNEDPTGMNNCVYPRNINSMKVNNILGLVMYIHSMYKKIKSTNKYVGGGWGGGRDL